MLIYDRIEVLQGYLDAEKAARTVCQHLQARGVSTAEAIAVHQQTTRDLVAAARAFVAESPGEG